jgi:hypothetical protein
MKHRKFNLSESPRNIEPKDSNLGFTVTADNEKLALAILNNKKAIKIEHTNLGNILYRYGNKFILVDPFYKKVVYYLSWNDRYFKIIDAVVSQEVLHWRDSNSFEYRNLSAHVFFDLLLPIHGKILTDHLHTSAGQRFWLRRIDEAFDRKLHVYCVYFLPTEHQSHKRIAKVNDKIAFNSLLIPYDSWLSHNPWGNQKKFEARRILISETTLNVPTEEI